MEHTRLPSELPQQESEWGELLDDYLQKLRTIPASTLDLSPEEKQTLTTKTRLAYRDETIRFRELRDRNGAETTHVLAQVIEELLSRHDSLSQHWDDLKANPKIIRTSPPDDLQGIDFIFSFSDNINCAIDITLAGKYSNAGEKKRRRQENYADYFKRAPLSFWRFPDGTIGYKEFPFLPLFIKGPMAADFIKNSASNLSQPLENTYQQQYKAFFAEIMEATSTEAVKMAKNMFEGVSAQKFLSPSLINQIKAIIESPGGTQEKTRGLQTQRKSITGRTQQSYYDLLMQYQIIHTMGKIVTRQLK